MSFLRETCIVFRRQLRMNLRNPAWVIIGVLQPVLYLLLFGPLLKPLVGQFGARRTPTRSSCPGMLVQLGMFGAFFAGFGLIGEWREGVIEAERVTPASRTALLVGRLLPRRAAAVRAGADPDRARLRHGHARLGRRAGARGGADAALGGACAAASNALALTTKSEDVMAPVINMVMMPVLLLSGILLPMTIGPPWLQRRQRLHADPARGRRGPRRLRRGLLSSGLYWGIGWSLALFGLAVWWGTAMFRKENS